MDNELEKEQEQSAEAPKVVTAEAEAEAAVGGSATAAQKAPEKKHARLVNAFKVIGFLLCVIATAAAMYFGCRPDMPGATRIYRSYRLNRVFSERRDSLDVLYVGHSGVYCGVSPMEIYEDYGIAGFNCSQELLMPWEAYETVVDVLEEQSPKVIALEVDQFFYDKTRNIINTNLKTLALGFFPFREMHNSWRDGFKRPERDFKKNFSVFNNVKPNRNPPKRKPTDKVYKLAEKHGKYLDAFYELCKKRNIELALFELPSLRYWTYDRHNCISEFAAAHGLKFLDMNVGDAAAAADIDWICDTRDGGDHLNYHGAKKATRVLGEWLNANYDIPDRRGAEGYSEWDKDLVKYKAEVNTKIYGK